VTDFEAECLKVARIALASTKDIPETVGPMRAGLSQRPTGGSEENHLALILKRALASRPSGQWSEDEFDVLSDGVVVGPIFKVPAAPIGSRGCGH
jgi:hypothetical protein